MDIVRLASRISSSSDVWYHSTKPDRVHNILTHGLKVNSPFNFTNDKSRMSILYGLNPIYLSKSPLHSKYPGTVLKVHVDPYHLMIDFGEILSYTEAFIDGEFIIFEYGSVGAGPVLSPYLVADENGFLCKLPYKDIVNDPDVVKRFIEEYGTATYPLDIPPSDISLSQ